MPSTILDPIAVTKDKVKDTIVKDNVYKVADICTSAFAEACAAAGLADAPRTSGWSSASAPFPPAGARGIPMRRTCSGATDPHRSGPPNHPKD